MEEQEPIVVRANISDSNAMFIAQEPIQTPPVKYKSYFLMLLISLMASSSYFYIGINCSFFVFFLPLLLQNLQDKETAMIFEIICSLLFLIFASLGSLFGGYLIRRIGRRRAFLIVDLFSIAAQLLLLVFFEPLFILTSILNGFLSGTSSMVTAVYLREMIPTRKIGHFLSLQPTILFLSLSLGMILLKLLSLSLMGLSVLIYTVVGVLLVRILFFGCVFTHETPIFLLNADQEFECETVLKIIYQEEFVRDVFSSLKQDLYTLRFRRNPKGELFFLSRKVSQKIRQRVGCTLLFFSQFVGFGAILCQSSEIIQKTVDESDTASWESVYFISSTLAIIGVASFLAGFAYDKLWHKPLIVVGSSIVFLSIAIHFCVSLLEGANSSIIYFFLMVIFAVGHCFGLGTGAFTSLVVFTPDLHFGYSLKWTGLAVVCFIFYGFESLFEEVSSGMDCIFAAISLITIVYIYVNYKEISGLSNYGIDLLMKESIMKYLPKRDEGENAEAEAEMTQ